MRTDGRTDGRLEPRCTRCSASHPRGARPATRFSATFICIFTVVVPRLPQRVQRGAHKDGLDVCAQYKAPNLAKLTDETLKSAYDCAACGKPMHDHVDVTPLDCPFK